MPTIAAIYRYPIKGLGPDPLDSAELVPGQTIAGDRLYAIENGPSGFDAAHPAYLPKSRFLMLMRNERLARLRAAFCARPRAAARSRSSLPPSAPTNCAARLRFSMAQATAFRTWRTRS